MDKSLNAIYLTFRIVLQIPNVSGSHGNHLYAIMIATKLIIKMIVHRLNNVIGI